MFERYTEPAKRVLFFSRYEASQSGSTSIHGEHILLGLIRETKGDAHPILSPLPLERIREEIVSRIPFEEAIGTSVEIPFFSEVKYLLTDAARQADGLRHTHIGPEHLLLALLYDEASVPGSILAAHGLTAEAVRARIEDRIEGGQGSAE